MKDRAADFISNVHNKLSTDLVNKLYTSKILEVARNLPMVSVISYECRLADNAPRVDIALCANGKSDGLTLKEIKIPSVINNAEDNLAFRAWGKVKKFGETWTDKNGSLGQIVSALWMNIDIELDNNAMTVPWVYVIFAHTLLPKDLKIAILENSLNLFEPNFPKKVVAQMVNKINQLPSKAHLLGLGLQSARRKETLRLVIYELNLTEVTAFLKLSKWPGNHEDFYSQMADFEPFAKSLGFIFDVDGTSIGTLVGIEFYIDRENHLGAIEKMLQLLVERDLCSQKKSNATIKWVKLANNTKKDNLERWVSHVKITYEPGMNSRAKIYLYHQFDLAYDLSL